MVDIEKVIWTLKLAEVRELQKGKEHSSKVLLRRLDNAIQTIRELQSTEDKVCEYSVKDDLVFDGCRKQSIASTFSYFNECEDFKYCPYCGRKIKVVEYGRY